MGEIEHLLGQLQLGDALEVLCLIANLIRVAQRQAQQAAVLWFERDDVLPASQHDPAECHHVHLANGVTDDGKGILSVPDGPARCSTANQYSGRRAHSSERIRQYRWSACFQFEWPRTPRPRQRDTGL